MDCRQYNDAYLKLTEGLRARNLGSPLRELSALRRRVAEEFRRRVARRMARLGYGATSLRGWLPGDLACELPEMRARGLGDPMPLLFDWCMAEGWLWWWDGEGDAVLSEDWPDDGRWGDMGVLCVTRGGDFYEDTGAGSGTVSAEARGMD